MFFQLESVANGVAILLPIVAVAYPLGVAIVATTLRGWLHGYAKYVATHRETTN